MNERTDEEIAREVQAGDREKFSVLVERYEPKLMRYANRFLLNGADAEDSVQESFLKAYANIRDFDASRRFSPWIYRIAHNEFVNAIKKRSGKAAISIFDLDTVFPSLVAGEPPDAEMGRRETKEILDKELSKLDLKYREPLVLYHYEELDYQEIADILKVPIGTVGVRLKRGREILKKGIKNNHNHG